MHRLGKGKGYGEIEYGICRELGVVTAATTVATVVHDTQVVDPVCLGGETLEPHDLPVDIICTPTRVIYTHTSVPKPPGIFWDLVTEEMLRDIGALRELQDMGKDMGVSRRQNG